MNGQTYCNFDLGLVNFFFEDEFINERVEVPDPTPEDPY